MIRGAFQETTHLHEFVSQPPGTLMIDLFSFRAPLGILGRLAETLVLRRYMKGLLLSRNRYLKQVAEAGSESAVFLAWLTARKREFGVDLVHPAAHLFPYWRAPHGHRLAPRR